jgi:hypothetical protein
VEIGCFDFSGLRPYYRLIPSLIIDEPSISMAWLQRLAS